MRQINLMPEKVQKVLGCLLLGVLFLLIGQSLSAQTCFLNSAGTISGPQQPFCGEVCDVVISGSPATGDGGVIEYLWLKNSAPNFPIIDPVQQGWVPCSQISTELQSFTVPGCITETTYFIRCARYKERIVNGDLCDFNIFGESNMVSVIKNNLSVSCSASPAPCAGAGSATATPVGGVSPYTYVWRNVANVIVGTMQTATGLNVGLYTVTVTDATGCEVNCTTEVKTACPPFICSYTQGFYGNVGGKHCGTESTTELLNRLVNNSNPILLGRTSTGRSISFSSGSCIISRLPGGGPSAELPRTSTNMPNNTTCEAALNYPLTSAGKFRNTLLAQTLTLTLNVRLSSNLGTLQLINTTITTAKASSCNPATAIPLSGTNASYTMPAKVINYLNNPLNGLSFGNTVNSLLELANMALGGLYSGGGGKPNLSEIATAIDVLNNAFDECRILISGASGSRLISGLNQEFSGNVINIDNVKVYPNPFSSRTNIEFSAKNAGLVSIEVFDMHGKLIKNVYSRQVNSNERILIKLDADGWASGVYNCRINTPDGQFFRKLILGN